jgi:RNA polymerase sigma factor (sigma-70 family)
VRDERDLGALVRAAADDEPRAWEALVTRFTPRIRSIARRHYLSPADQDEVLQRTWMRLLEHIDGLVMPAAIGGWLATTARNESLAILRSKRRELPMDEVPSADHRDTPDPTDVIVAEQLEMAARTKVLRNALNQIDGRKRALLELLLDEAPTSYAEISRALKMPVGSIGPTRARTLARLRRDPQIASLLDDAVQSPRPTRPIRPDAFDIL